MDTQSGVDGARRIGLHGPDRPLRSMSCSVVLRDGIETFGTSRTVVPA
jgi:hypothetical protein